MSAGQTAVFCGREDNRGSDVALAMRHRLCGISNYELNGLRKEDEHPAHNHSKVTVSSMSRWEERRGKVVRPRCEHFTSGRATVVGHTRRRRHVNAATTAAAVRLIALHRGT